MRNIFLFIRRYFTFIIFVILQGVALWLLFTYNRFHRGKGMGLANEVTGWVNGRYNTVEDFFRMREENKRLLHLNDSLINLLPSNFVQKDTSQQVTKDSIPYDTLGHYRQYIWREAQVLYNTVNSEKNYVQINRGSNQGMKDNMGVLSSDGGVVGQIVNVSPNFSVVMSLLHIQSRLNVLVKKTQSSGMISWDAKEPRMLTLSGIPKTDSLKVGDTILTGNYSLSYPPGHMVGTVASIQIDKTSNFYNIKVRSKANFNNLQQVMVVENMDYTDQQQLLDDSRKKVEEIKK